MPSPFPGMDPYLEPHWLDVHTKLVASAANALNVSLPDDLVAVVEERAAVTSRDDGDDRVFGPDVKVADLPAAETWVSENPGAAAVAAPYRLTVGRAEPITERFIRVVEAGSERLVTVIEFVSPTNKRRPGLRAFRFKRRELLKAGVNVVEVDLVRAGDWRSLLRPHRCPPEARTLYRVTFRVPRDRRAVYLHPIPLRSPLPTIPVPLRPHDPEVRLGLQPLLDAAYATGRYERRLRPAYNRPPDPPLEDDDAAWADELLRAAGRR